MEWKLDGTVITGQTGRTLPYSSSSIGNGTHTLAATAKDTTTKMRKDTAGLLDDTSTWTLNISSQGPAAPTALTAVLRPDGGVNLTWIDATSDKAGFAIERALGTSKTYTDIGRVGVNATAHTDSTTTPGTTTQYRVRGVNATNTAMLGFPSNVATVIPQIAPSPMSATGSLIVPRGQPASFTVQAAGTLLRYQWRRNMSNITTQPRAPTQWPPHSSWTQARMTAWFPTMSAALHILRCAAHGQCACRNHGPPRFHHRLLRSACDAQHSGHGHGHNHISVAQERHRHWGRNDQLINHQPTEHR